MTCCSLGEDDAMRMFQRWQKRTLLIWGQVIAAAAASAAAVDKL